MRDVIVKHREFGEGEIETIELDNKSMTISILWKNGSRGTYSADELEFEMIQKREPIKHLKQALGIIKEFVTDVENHGLEITGEDWPELFITYQHAVKILS